MSGRIGLAHLETMGGNLDEAAALLTFVSQNGNKEWATHALHQLGHLELRRTNRERAKTAFENAVSRNGDPHVARLARRDLRELNDAEEQRQRAASKIREGY